jgi:uncharacterized protein YoxC
MKIDDSDKNTELQHENKPQIGGAPITEEQVERFVQHFERSARRWEVIVYPAMFAFVVLAGYGFFLIYSLTSSIATIATGFEPMTQHMSTMSSSMVTMTKQVTLMSKNMDDMAVKLNTLPDILDNIGQMRASIESMSSSIHRMNDSTHQMNKTMGSMNQSVARPMNFFNQWMPWGP